jgi:hypothetical protein
MLAQFTTSQTDHTCLLSRNIQSTCLVWSVYNTRCCSYLQCDIRGEVKRIQEMCTLPSSSGAFSPFLFQYLETHSTVLDMKHVFRVFVDLAFQTFSESPTKGEIVRYFCPILSNIGNIRQISMYQSSTKFNENPFICSRIVHAYGQKDRSKKGKVVPVRN